MNTKADRIHAALEAALSPSHLEVLDESHMHSRGLETHYKATVVSEAFAGQSPVRRHQAVYAALGGLMREFHALALHTYTAAEWARLGAAPESPRCLGGSRHDPAPAAAPPGAGPPAAPSAD
ncbi:MAG: BolA family transcriptional regulator [Gammaproteobacteria bacterium]|nr:BolA family transcriptional regulator [Gammaproteobacteria bacterium]